MTHARTAVCLGAAAALLLIPRLALCVSVKHGGFTCRADGVKGSTTLAIEHGGKKATTKAPQGTWDPDGMTCTSWKGKAVRLALPGSAKEAYEVFAGLDDGGAVRIAWEGRTGLAGEFGERWGWFLDWEPKKPGGKNIVPILYALHEQVRLCGYGMVPLYVKAYDPASVAFRPISFDRLRRAGSGWGGTTAPSEAKSPSKPITVNASLALESDPPGPPALDSFLNFRSSSSTFGDTSNLAFKTAPLGLGDGESTSGWVEGTGGHGWGEFVTAVVSEDDLPITSLVLHATRGTDSKEVGKWNRLKEFELTLSGGRRFVVKVPTDPGKHPDRPVVVAFPEPVHTQCLSVIVRKVYEAKKTGGEHTYLGEVTAYTSLDSGSGIEEFLGWFEDPDRANRAMKLMRDLNPSALPSIVDAWSDLGPATRKGIVGSIHADWSPNLEPLVAKVAGSAFEDEDADLFALLSDRLVPLVAGETGSPFVESMSTWIEDSSRRDLGATAIGVLGRAGHPTELRALVGVLFETTGAGWGPWPEVDLHGWIREGLVRGGMEGLEVVGSTLEEADLEDEDSLRSGLVLLYLLDYEEGGDPVRSLAASWAARLWDEVPTLFCRHHLLPIAAKLVAFEDRSGYEIAAKAFADPDVGPPLKMEALEAMSKAQDELVPLVIDTAIQGLDDPCPGVRAAAVSLLKRIGASGPGVEDRVVDLGVNDAWPEVRIEAIRAAARFEAVPIEAIWDFLRDKDSSARKEAIRLVVDSGIATEEVGILLANSSLAKSMRPDVRAAAAHAIGKLCITEMAMPMGNVLFYGTTPDADEGEISAAAAAAEAIGMLGDPGPLESLVDATRPGLRLEIRIASIKALGIIGGPKASKVLAELSKSPDPAVQAAATQALQAMAAHVPPACATGE